MARTGFPNTSFDRIAAEAKECRRQASLCAEEARFEPDPLIHAVLLTMVDTWETLANQIEWIKAARIEHGTKR
jgi:hypothetical protein